LIVIAQNVYHDLVADVWLGWCGRRMTAVVSSLSSARCRASFNTCLVRLNFVESKELSAHVRVSVGDWVVRCIDRAIQFHRSAEAGLGVRRSQLVITIASDDHNLKGGICFVLAIS